MLGPCDHVPVRSWALFKVRDLLRDSSRGDSLPVARLVVGAESESQKLLGRPLAAAHTDDNGSQRQAEESLSRRLGRRIARSLACKTKRSSAGTTPLRLSAISLVWTPIG